MKKIIRFLEAYSKISVRCTCGRQFSIWSSRVSSSLKKPSSWSSGTRSTTRVDIQGNAAKFNKKISAEKKTTNKRVKNCRINCYIFFKTLNKDTFAMKSKREIITIVRRSWLRSISAHAQFAVRNWGLRWWYRWLLLCGWRMTIIERISCWAAGIFRAWPPRHIINTIFESKLRASAKCGLLLLIALGPPTLFLANAASVGNNFCLFEDPKIWSPIR